ncbi:MAG: Hint domain-containing protein [Paracoccaceae bacterium]
MARISELHYSNAYARSSGVSEFLEVSLSPGEDPADFTVTFYQSSGAAGFEVTLDDPGVQVTVDPDSGETAYVISADVFPILLTDPDGGGSNNYEAYALTETGTASATVIDFYDIGGGTTNIVANGGAADGATSQNLPVLVGPNSTTTTLQFNLPNPTVLTYGTVSPGDTGIACFVSGTPIETDRGPVAVERLKAGDLVQTMDRGLQPLRWRGARTIRGRGRYAPVRISAGALGARETVLVSPQHRILVSGWQAELLFGEPELLVPARALVGGAGVQRAPCDLVTYHHLMFDQHEILFSGGLASESLLPGAQSFSGFEAAAVEEIYAIFPELRISTDTYGGTARRTAPMAVAGLLRAG